MKLDMRPQPERKQSNVGSITIARGRAPNVVPARRAMAAGTAGWDHATVQAFTAALQPGVRFPLNQNADGV